jgi:hypothetical protein
MATLGELAGEGEGERRGTGGHTARCEGGGRGCHEGAAQKGARSFLLVLLYALLCWLHKEEEEREEREKKRRKGRTKNGKISKFGNFWEEKEKIIYEVGLKIIFVKEA